MVKIYEAAQAKKNQIILRTLTAGWYKAQFTLCPHDHRLKSRRKMLVTAGCRYGINVSSYRVCVRADPGGFSCLIAYGFPMGHR